MLHDVYLSLGSNIGKREKYIERAIEDLCAVSTIQKKSKIIETDPVGYEDQNKFLNCVVFVKTPCAPEELLQKIKKIENDLGRKRLIHWGPRTIDIDIIFYDDLILNSEVLIIPHSRMHERLFVLESLVEVNPDYIHPIFKKTIKELYKDICHCERSEAIS